METKESAPAASVVVEAVKDGFVGTELPRLDSAGEEEEKVEAELAVLFDPCGEGRDDGDMLDTVAAIGTAAGESRGGETSEQRGEMGAGEVVGVVACVFYLQGSRWSAGHSGMGRTAWLQWPLSPLWRKRRREERKNPPGSSFFNCN